jgi:hypothetical protein
LQSNRANAQLSTGPISAAGKAKSSKNALRHGLSVRRLDAERTAAAHVYASRIAKLIDMDPSACLEFASLELEIQRIRKRRAEICKTLDEDVSWLKTLIAMIRYQREAESKQRSLLRQNQKRRDAVTV